MYFFLTKNKAVAREDLVKKHMLRGRFRIEKFVLFMFRLLTIVSKCSVEQRSLVLARAK